MYNEFANVYDRLQDIDYGSFIDYYENIFEKFNIKPKLMLDLGCGTGNITIPLSQKGYEMIGIDLSEEMLHIAAQKAREKNLDILFLNQDMTEFELYGTVDAIICSLDGVNYLTMDDDLKKLFALIKNYLNPDGLFIFDINSEYKLKSLLSDNSFVYDEDDVYCVWSNSFDDTDNICSFNIDIFIKQENGLYKKYEEYHEERAYSIYEIETAIKNAGLNPVGIYNDRSFDAADDKSERIFFIAKK